MNKRKVLEIKGLKSLRALNAYNALMLGLKMLPDHLGESYEDFMKRLDGMPEKNQRSMIKKAALFVELEPEEVRAIILFCTDKNGVPYSEENINNLTPDELVEIITEVCYKISQFKIDLVSDTEKKNLKILV